MIDTRQEYIENGEGCPFCGQGGNVEGGPITIVANEARQRVWCTECGKEWTDVYGLDHIEEDLS